MRSEREVALPFGHRATVAMATGIVPDSRRSGQAGLEWALLAYTWDRDGTGGRVRPGGRRRAAHRAERPRGRTLRAGQRRPALPRRPGRRTARAGRRPPPSQGIRPGATGRSPRRRARGGDHARGGYRGGAIGLGAAAAGPAAAALSPSARRPPAV